MLKEGVVDGTFFPAETALSFKLDEVTGHQLGFRDGLFGAAYFVVMNEEAFENLSPEHQRIIEETTGEALARMIGKAWDDSEIAAINTLEQRGTFTWADEALAAEVMGRLQPLTDDFVATAGAKGIDGEAALAHMKAELAKEAAAE